VDDAHAPAGAEPFPPTRFELRFRFDLADYMAMAKQVRWTALERSFTFMSPVAIGIFGALVAQIIWSEIVAWFPDTADINGELYAMLAAIALLYLLYRVVLMPAYLRGSLHGQPIGMGETVVMADENGLTSTSADVVTALKWPRVVAMRETKDHIVIMYARLVGIAVPKRAFESAIELQRFIAFVRSKGPPAA